MSKRWRAGLVIGIVVGGHSTSKNLCYFPHLLGHDERLAVVYV